MDGQELKNWMERHNLQRRELAVLTDKSVNTIDNYLRGFRYMDKGGHMAVDIPKDFELALAAIEMGITEYNGEPIT